MRPTFDAEQQLQLHGRALRTLAGELLADAHAADDATQEVWAQALRTGPRHERSLGGWLRTLLVHVVSRLRRGERRRRAREAARAAQRGGTADDHAEVLAREEIAQKLLAAVAALQPPYRDVVWARFFEDKAPRDIAAERGEAVATVKSRLQRGLGILRAQLGEQGDGGGDWRAGCAMAFALRPPAAAAAMAVTGGVFVATWIKVCAFLAVVVAAALWWWPPEIGPGGPRDTGRVGQAAVAAERVAPVAEAALPAPNDVRREAAAPAAPAPAATLCTLHGRCVDEAGRAIAGCVATVGGSPLRRGDEAAAPAWQAPEPVTTGADGRFVFSFVPPPPMHLWLSLAAPGLAEMRGNWDSGGAGSEIAVGDVIMPPGITLRVRVVEPDDSPCPDAQWHLTSDLRGGDAPGAVVPVRYLAGRVDGNGLGAASLRFAPGRYELGASEGQREAEPQSLRLDREQPIVDVTIRMKGVRQPTIQGRVVDDRGEPVRFASLVQANDQMAMTGADGRFTLHRSPEDADETVVVRIDARGFARTVTPPLAWGSRNVELRLRAGIGLTLAVQAADGTAVCDYTVRCVPLASRTSSSEQDRVRARGPFEGGIAEIPGVAGGMWRIVIEFPAESGLPAWVDEVAIPEEGGRVDVKVQVARRNVRVVTRAGEPVAATHVQLLEPPSDARAAPLLVMQSTPNWLASRGPGHARLVCERQTDRGGRCELLGRSGRTFLVRVLGPGHAPIAVAAVSLDDPNELTVEVGRGARVSGRITPADALAQLERYDGEKDEQRRRGNRPTLRLEPNEGTSAFSTWTSEGVVDAPRVALAADGSYEFVGQPAGSWNLVVEFVRSFPQGGGFGDKAKLGRIDLVEGQEVRCDLDLTWLLPTWLAAEVTWNGAPFANGTVGFEGTFRDADGQWRGSNTFLQRTDANGAFRLLVRPGTFEIVLKKDAEGRDTPPLRCPVPAVVVAGPKTAHTFAITTGRIELTVLDAAGKPAEGVVVFVGDERCRLPATDAAGCAAGEVLAGSRVLRLLPGDLEKSVLGRDRFPRRGDEDPFSGQWIELGAAMVAPGSTAKHEVRLPPAIRK